MEAVFFKAGWKDHNGTPVKRSLGKVRVGAKTEVGVIDIKHFGNKGVNVGEQCVALIQGLKKTMSCCRLRVTLYK